MTYQATQSIDHQVGIPAITSACGKAIIVGEHAVVYGSRALAMPLPGMKVTFILKPNSVRTLTKHHLTINGRSDRITPIFYQVVDDAQKLLGLPHSYLDMDIFTDIPLGAGLGSSASLCVGLLRLLGESYGLELTKLDICKYANELEKHFHGSPSGLDTAIVSYEDFMLFSKHQTPQPIQIQNQRSWYFALIDSQTRSSTATMVKQAQPFFLGSEGEKRIAAFDSLVDGALDALFKGRPEIVGQIMNTAARYLQEIMVIPDHLHEMMKKVEQLGVYGVKPTGAGGGGCLLALLNNENARSQARQLTELFGKSNVFTVTI